MKFASQTTVSADRSKAEIEATLKNYGADQFMSGWKDGHVIVGFRVKNSATFRMIRFVLPMPELKDFKLFTFKRNYRGRISEQTRERGEIAQRDAHDQEIRRRWRALSLVIKAKLEAVQSGITTFEEEFLAHIILPTGRTVYEETRAGIHQAYESGKVDGNLLGFGGAK